MSPPLDPSPPSQAPSPSRNLLQRLADRLPGYRGYRDREERREADQLAREHLARRLEVARDAVVQAAAARTDAGDLQALQALGRLERQVERLGESVRFTNAGLSGLFAPVRVGTATLDALLRHDLDALEAAEAVVVAAALLPSDPDPASTREALTAFEAVWRRRQTLLESPESAPETTEPGANR